MHRIKNRLSSTKSKQRRADRAQSDGVRGAADEETLRMSKHVQDEAHRFQRNTTMNTSSASSNSSYMSDSDAEDIVYNGPGSRATGGSMRSTDTYNRSTSSGSMRNTDSFSSNSSSNGNAMRVTDMYRTTEQLRGTNLTPLHEDEELRATLPSASSSSTNTIDALRAELADVKRDVHAIRSELMNEIHVTRYDVLKEVTMLKGTILQLVAALESRSNGPALLTSSSSVNTMELSQDERAAISQPTGVQTSRATRDRLAARDDPTTAAAAGTTMLARASSRLTQLAPVADDALSTPLLQHQIDELFPLIDSDAALRTHAQRFDAASRAWAISRVQHWLESRFNAGTDNVLALVGDGGVGKSVFTAAICDEFAPHVAARHLCEFDRKAKSSPRNVLLSLVHQLVANVPRFKNQLARLNLRYVLEEADVTVLARKVLLEPLQALEAPADVQVIVIDGIDQCTTLRTGKNDLLEFLADIQPELPLWLGLFVTSKPRPELPAKLAITSLLDFSSRNSNYMQDAAPLIDGILSGFADADQPAARSVLQQKSAGHWTFLEFTTQALSHPGMADAVTGAIPLDVLQDLPESIYEIFDEIFEDKFGQGHSRTWKKCQPLLSLIATAASGPFPLVTETHAQSLFGLTKDDVRSIRRSFADIVAVRHGTYRIESSALFDWLTDPQRASEQFYVDVASSMSVLRQLHKQQPVDASDTHSVASSDTSSDNTNVSSASSYQSFVVPQPAATAAAGGSAKGVSFKPVGILKNKRG